MSFITTARYSIIRTAVALLVAVSVIAPPFFTAHVPVAEAQGVCVGAIVAFIATGIASVASAAAEALGSKVLGIADPTVVPSHESSIFSIIREALTSGGSLVSAATDWDVWFKECVLDPLAWAMKTVIVEQLTASVIEWINSGFEGTPTFMQDPQAFFFDLSDKVAGAFLFGSDAWGGGLEFLCEPFRLDVQVSLALSFFQPTFEERGRLGCTLSDAVANVETFLAGDFVQGGFPGWFELTMNPRNNPHGAMLMAEGEMGLRINDKTLFEKDLLAAAENYLSIRDDEGRVITPGTYIASQLEDYTGSPLANLEAADELAEIIDALFSALIKEIMSGALGLFGMSGGEYQYGADAGGRGAGSYAAQLRTQAAGAATAANCTTSKSVLATRLSDARANALANGLTTIVSEIDIISARLTAADCSGTNFYVEIGQIEGQIMVIEGRLNPSAPVTTPTTTPTTPPTASTTIPVPPTTPPVTPPPPFP